MVTRSIFAYDGAEAIEKYKTAMQNKNPYDLVIMDLTVPGGIGGKEAIIEEGATRLTPVILTAASTILGLLPLAVGMNIDFASFFTTLDPKIYFGGDNAMFWKPLSWTIIFGLSFATILTLIIVPSMLSLKKKKK